MVTQAQVDVPINYTIGRGLAALTFVRVLEEFDRLEPCTPTRCQPKGIPRKVGVRRRHYVSTWKTGVQPDVTTQDHVASRKAKLSMIASLRDVYPVVVFE